MRHGIDADLLIFLPDNPDLTGMNYGDSYLSFLVGNCITCTGNRQAMKFRTVSFRESKNVFLNIRSQL